MSKPVILTGIRSNDELTLGNYLGAIEPMIRMANEKASDYQINLFVPDLHSFTTPIEHKDLYKRTMNNIKTFVALGLPIEHSNVFIYRQSYIQAHSELAWILSCFTGFGEAGRMVEFKDKSERLSKERVSVGLFNYPILMAADILLYGAKWVPVGEDQRQHLELARDLAQRINNQFGHIFELPEEIKKQQEFVSRDAAPRIRSLKNPDKKMSKSVSDPGGTILLSDQPDDAAKKVMSATTDSVGTINLDWEKQPGISNLLQISALLDNKSLEEVAKQWTGQTNYSDLKSHVAAQIENFLNSLQSNQAKVNESQLVNKLEQDEAVMSKIANTTLLKIQKAVGLRPA